mmetsp:Transcript_45861/g.106607  ORF Transcript_45861/g.106607 Transcript_45861/m.106607 type:complete len:375 (+) Transcript_45861:95-1219(+)
MTTHATQFFLDGLVAPPGGSRSRPSPRRKWRRASFGSPVAEKGADTSIEAAAYCTCSPIPRTPEPAASPADVAEPEDTQDAAPDQGTGVEKEAAARPASPLLYRTVPHNGGGGFKLRNGAKLRAPSPVGVVAQPQHPADACEGTIEEALLDVHAAQLSPPRHKRAISTRKQPTDAGGASGSIDKAPKPILHTTPEPLPEDLSAQIAAIVKAITAPLPTIDLLRAQEGLMQARPSSAGPLSKVSSYDHIPPDEAADQEVVPEASEEEASSVFKGPNVASKALQTATIPDFRGGSSRPPGTTVRVQLVAENTVPFEERKWVKVHRKVMTQEQLRRRRYEQQLKQLFPALPQVSGTVLQSPLNLLRRSAEDSPRVWR